MARVRAVLRRGQPDPEEPTLLELGELRLDVTRHELAVEGRPVELTPSEFALLQTLMASPGRVFSRTQLLEATLGDAFEGYERNIDTHIKNLRKKIEPNPRRPKHLLTVHGLGYKIQEG